MNREALIDEVLKAVEKKIAALKIENRKDKKTVRLSQDAKSATTCLEVSKNKEGKKRLLIIDRPQCEPLEQASYDELTSHYKVDFAGEQNYNSDPNSYEEIVVIGMDIEHISKITNGIYDTPFLRLIARCIMEGKKAFVFKESIEIFQYLDTAPKGFISFFQSKMQTMASWDLIIRDKRFILKRLNKGQNTLFSDDGKTVFLDGKILSKRDVTSLYLQGFREICISSETKVTDVALECAKNNGLVIRTK